MTTTTTRIPNQAIDLIKEFEGCARRADDGLIHAYPDPGSGGDPWTIGWGTTVLPNGTKVRPGLSITSEDADKYFITDLQENYWQKIEDSIPHWHEMNDEMRAALCSFAYNLGVSFYGDKANFGTITSCLKDKRWDDVPKALMLYVNPGSNVEAGLRRRRGREADLWQTGLGKLNGQAIPPASLQSILEAITDTFLKKEIKDSSELLPHQLVPVVAKRQYKIERVLEESGNSVKVQLAYDSGDWWIYKPHWKTIAIDAAFIASKGDTRGQERIIDTSRPHLLDVPYFSQLDNRNNPTGSCNVTCVAMCLAYLGMPYDKGNQLEDQLYQKMETLGWDRHSGYDLMRLVESFPGYKDIFKKTRTIKDLQASIDAGHPCIVHGYFTRSGHIIVLRGYDDKGFFVNDPNGEYFARGYDNNRSGKCLHYSYSLIARTCSQESVNNPQDIWAHTVFRV